MESKYRCRGRSRNCHAQYPFGSTRSKHPEIFGQSSPTRGDTARRDCHICRRSNRPVRLLLFVTKCGRILKRVRLWRRWDKVGRLGRRSRRDRTPSDRRSTRPSRMNWSTLGIRWSPVWAKQIFRKFSHRLLPPSFAHFAGFDIATRSTGTDGLPDELARFRIAAFVCAYICRAAVAILSRLDDAISAFRPTEDAGRLVI